MGFLETLAIILLGWACCGWVGMLLARFTDMIKSDRGQCEIDRHVFIVFTGFGPIALVTIIAGLVLEP